MDNGTIIAIIGVTIANIAAMFSLFLWVRSEANSDRKEFNAIQREDRKDLLQISKNLESMVRAIQEEIKDFHNRLCILDERTRKDP